MTREKKMGKITRVDRVLDFLFLSNEKSASNLQYLQSFEIQVIVNGKNFSSHFSSHFSSYLSFFIFKINSFFCFFFQKIKSDKGSKDLSSREV